MKNIFKKCFVAGLFGISMLGLASCGNEGNSTTSDDSTKTRDLLYGANITSVDASKIDFVQNGKLTVGMSTDFAPSEFIDSTQTGQNKFVGSDVSFAQALAKAFGVELEVKAMDFGLVLGALDQNLIDIAISGFSYTPTRAASYTPSNCYWDEGDDGQVIMINAKDSSTYPDLESLNKSSIKIAVQTNSLQEMLVTEQIPNATRIVIANLDDAITKLQSGAIDAVAFAGGVADLKIQQDSSLAIVPTKLDDTGYTGNFAWVKKGNTALIDATNTVISEVKKNNYYKTWKDNAEALVLALGDKAEEIIPE